MNNHENVLFAELTRAFTRVSSLSDARSGVLELLARYGGASAHLIELEPLSRRQICDIRSGPLFSGTNFGAELTRFLWCNPTLAHLPRLRELRVFRQQDIVGDRLWYASTYYNEFFRRYGHDDTKVMMFLRSSYAFASIRPKGDPYPRRVLRFLDYVHPLIESGLLNLQQWTERWVHSEAIERMSENARDALAVFRSGALLNATRSARGILGLDKHGASGNLFLADCVHRSEAAGSEGCAFPAADGRAYRMVVLRTQWPGEGDVLLVRFIPLAGQPLDIPREQIRARGLTERESRVMELAIDGRGAREIARVMGISSNTVRTHLRSAYAKLNVSNRVEALNRLRGPTPFN